MKLWLYAGLMVFVMAVVISVWALLMVWKVIVGLIFGTAAITALYLWVKRL